MPSAGLSIQQGKMPLLRHRQLILVVVAVGALTGACAGDDLPATGELQGVGLEEPSPKESFLLEDTDGHPFDFATETDGRLTFLYFGYTNCPDVCPVHLAQLAEVFEQLPEVRRNSTVVFVTVDPDRDKPEVIRSFLDAFSSDFIGLTGTQAELEKAQKAVGVPVAVREGETDTYTMAHASQVLVFAPDGLGYSVYPFGTRQADWIHDLPILLERTSR